MDKRSPVDRLPPITVRSGGSHVGHRLSKLGGVQLKIYLTALSQNLSSALADRLLLSASLYQVRRLRGSISKLYGQAHGSRSGHSATRALVS